MIHEIKSHFIKLLGMALIASIVFKMPMSLCSQRTLEYRSSASRLSNCLGLHYQDYLRSLVTNWTTGPEVLVYVKGMGLPAVSQVQVRQVRVWCFLF